MTDRFLATLIYAVHDGRVLLLHRTKEPNLGLWVAPGGKLEFDESPHECAVRELAEESGLQALNPHLRGLITEVSPRDDYQWLIFIFVADQLGGALTDCDRRACPEGKLAWIPIDQVMDMAIPPADAIFFPQIIRNGPLFCAKFVYDRQLGIVEWEQYPE